MGRGYPAALWERIRIPNTNLQPIPNRENEGFTAKPFHYDGNVKNGVLGSNYCFGHDIRSSRLDYRGSVLSHFEGQSGAALCDVDSTLIFHGSGHNAAAINNTLAIGLEADHPSYFCVDPSSNWIDVGSPTAVEGATDDAVFRDPLSYFNQLGPEGRSTWVSAGYFGDGKHVGGHTCYFVQFDQIRHRLVCASAGNNVFGMGAQSGVCVMPWSLGRWALPSVGKSGTYRDGKSMFGSIGFGFYYSNCCMDPATGDLYQTDSGSTGFTMWDATTFQVTNLARPPMRGNKSDPMVIIPNRGKKGKLYCIESQANEPGGPLPATPWHPRLCIYDMASDRWDAIKTTGDTTLDTVYLSYKGMVYEPNLDRLLLMEPYDLSIKIINPDTGVMTNAPMTGVAPGNQGITGTQQGIMGRFRYVPNLKAVVFGSAAAHNGLPGDQFNPNDAQGCIYIVRTST